MQEGNTTLNGQAIFGGFQTTFAPFSVDANGNVTYTGDQGQMTVAVGDNVSLQLNHNGADIMNMNGAADPSQPDLFTTLQTLSSDITSGNQGGINDCMTQLSAAASRISGDT